MGKYAMMLMMSRGSKHQKPEHKGYSHEPLEEYPMDFSKEAIHKWMRRLENSDGTTGAKWTREQTDEIMRRSAVKCNPMEFYATMNMLYSDYGKVAHEFGVCSEAFFSRLAEAFLCDADAVEDKLEEYWEHVVRR